MLNLAQGKIDKFYKVVSVSQNAPFKIKRRLYELGFTRNVKAKVLRKSMLSQALLVELRGYTLSMRKNIVQYLEVEE